MFSLYIRKRRQRRKAILTQAKLVIELVVKMFKYVRYTIFLCNKVYKENENNVAIVFSYHHKLV